MAAKDLFHPHVRHALEKDGWTITHDPLTLPWGSAPVQVDLGAEKIIAAEKGARKIAVEVKSFLRSSRTEDLEDAMGQLPLVASCPCSTRTISSRAKRRIRELHRLAARNGIFTG